MHVHVKFLAHWTYLELEVIYAVTSEDNQLICARCCGTQQNLVTILAVTDEITTVSVAICVALEYTKIYTCTRYVTDRHGTALR